MIEGTGEGTCKNLLMNSHPLLVRKRNLKGNGIIYQDDWTTHIFQLVYCIAEWAWTISNKCNQPQWPNKQGGDVIKGVWARNQTRGSFCSVAIFQTDAVRASLPMFPSRRKGFRQGTYLQYRGRNGGRPRKVIAAIPEKSPGTFSTFYAWLTGRGSFNFALHPWAIGTTRESKGSI